MNFEEKLKDKKIMIAITKSNFGGAQRYVFNNALNFKKQGFDVSVAFGGSGELARKLNENDIKTFSIKGMQRDVSLMKEMESLFSLLGLFFRKKPKIVHLNSSKIGSLGSFCGRILNTFYLLTGQGKKRMKIVFTAHGFAFNEDRGVLQKIFIYFAYWITLLFSHRTISVSKSAKKQISFLPFVKNKISVVLNGIEDYEVFEKEKARKSLSSKRERLSERNKTEGLLWIGTISEFHPIKGLSVMVDALAEVLKERKDFVFVIIGEEGKERSKIEKKIKDLGLSDNVFILGFVKKAPRFLKAIDIFTLTSFSEGLPYSLLEAGHAERAVVASDVGGIPEVIQNGVNGILAPPGDRHALAESLLELMENKEVRESMGRALKGRINRVFQASKTAEETLKVYSELF